MFESVTPVANAIMRGVAASGVMDGADEARYGKAVAVMRSEMMALITGPEYADARTSVLNRSLSEAYVIGLVIAQCVAKIGAKVDDPQFS